jgi:hypothetical protein
MGYFIDTTDSAAPICSSCASILNVDLSTTPTDNTYCVCLEGYYWDEANFNCAECSLVTEVTKCKLCKNHVSNTAGDKCLACSTIDNTNLTYNPVNGGCNCQPGYTWRAADSICVACSSADNEAECWAETCAGYYYDNNKGSNKCDLCSNTENTNATANDILYGRSVCTCVNDYAWAVAETSPGSCGDCGVGANNAETCETVTCPNWLYDDTTASCIQSCTGAGSGAEEGQMFNGECFCKPGFAWNSNTRFCDPCAENQNETVCLTFCSLNYLWFSGKTKCLDCSGANNTEGPEGNFLALNG